MSWLKILMLIILASPVSSADRPTYYEFSPAYPKEIKEFEIDGRISTRFKEFIVEDLVFLSAKGEVDSVRFADSTKYIYNEYISNYLEQIKFEPAKFKNKKVSSILPIRVHHRPRNNTVITYPVSDSLTIENQILYYDALRSNQINPPAIVAFPPIFCDLAKSDTLVSYPFTVVKVAIDETGRAYDMNIDQSTYPAFEHQTKFAALNAQYQPAEIMGEKVKSTAYIIVRFFDEISYPTRKWLASDVDSMNYLEQRLVELLPEKIGHLSDPIVRNASANKLKKSDFYLKVNQNLVCWLMIDDYGQMYIKRLSQGIRNNVPKIKEQYEKTKFYPALDFDGNPLVVQGLVNIDHLDESYVRINYIW